MTLTEVDLCEKYGTCSQKCEYHKGEHHPSCSCDVGYLLKLDPARGAYTCMAKDGKTQMMLALEQNLVQYNFTKMSGHNHSIVVSGWLHQYFQNCLSFEKDSRRRVYFNVVITCTLILLHVLAIKYYQ